MIIRNAKIKDSETIAKNNVMLADEAEGEKLSYDKALEGVKSVISDLQKGFYIVAEENQKIIGELFITYEWSDWFNHNCWWVQSVYVDKAHRGKEVFKDLLDYVKQLSIENDVKSLKLYVYNKNEKAIKAYEKNGMKRKPHYIYEMKY